MAVKNQHQKSEQDSVTNEAVTLNPRIIPGGDCYIFCLKKGQLFKGR